MNQCARMQSEAVFLGLSHLIRHVLRIAHQTVLNHRHSNALFCMSGRFSEDLKVILVQCRSQVLQVFLKALSSCRLSSRKPSPPHNAQQKDYHLPL